MDTDAAVRQNAAYHAQLLGAIAELDYVPPALTEQTKLISNLEVDARRTREHIAELERRTTKERREHEALRDSTARRFAAKITGRKEKFAARASKEEREYIEALEREMQEKRQKATLDEMISEAKAVESDLKSKLQRYEGSKKELADLYSNIFDGPTQAYPEDDRLEYDLNTALGRYNEIQGYLNCESQAVNLLRAANGALLACSRQIQEALSYSTWDMFGGGGLSDMMERNALSRAEGHARQAAMHVEQAKMASPHVKPIGQIDIAHGSIISDVIFDNIFTDMMFHDKIKASARNLEAVQYNLTNELAFAKNRVAAISTDLSVASDALTSARGALDAFRRRVFENLAGGMDIPPLPAYDAAGASGAPIAMPQPQAPPPAGGYAPPPGPPPSSLPRGKSPTPSSGSYTSPAAPPPFSSTTSLTPGSYAPPPGPPPSSSSSSSYAPPPPSEKPLPPSPHPAAANWGSRNPYAAALIASPPRSPVPLPSPGEKAEKS